MGSALSCENQDARVAKAFNTKLASPGQTNTEAFCFEILLNYSTTARFLTNLFNVLINCGLILRACLSNPTMFCLVPEFPWMPGSC